ncbi:MAG: acyl-CoA dehydrogenase family protein [Acidimicrobiales bacterium]
MRTDAGEGLDEFRQRARSFIQGHLPPMSPRKMALTLRNERTDEEELAGVARDRQIQRMLFDAGLAGVCFPREYGGQGLTPAHQRVLNEELAGYEYPARFQAPTMSPCAAVLLDFGTEEQKLRHIPAILRGDEFWMQFLSEPSGGSDVAAALTTAMRDGDSWILNGSKIWTTGAWWSDWALCLARTNWDVPKHRGLTVFMLPIHQPGVEVHRIEMVNGSKEFCQEYMTDVVVPDSDRVGGVDEGWTVGIRWTFHERMLMNSPLVTIPLGTPMSGLPSAVRSIADAAGRLDDPRARDLVGEARMLDLVAASLGRRLRDGIASGDMTDQAGAIGRLFTATATARRTSIAFEVAAEAGGTWAAGDGDVADCGTDFLMRQVSCIGGGTTEMARNVISERVLGMPREQAFDRGVPFREVPRGRARQT